MPASLAWTQVSFLLERDHWTCRRAPIWLSCWLYNLQSGRFFYFRLRCWGWNRWGCPTGAFICIALCDVSIFQTLAGHFHTFFCSYSDLLPILSRAVFSHGAVAALPSSALDTGSLVANPLPPQPAFHFLNNVCQSFLCILKSNVCTFLYVHAICVLGNLLPCGQKAHHLFFYNYSSFLGRGFSATASGCTSPPGTLWPRLQPPALLGRPSQPAL